MATKTEIYELRKKEENDFYNVEDFNDNMDTLETALTEFDDSGTAEGVTSFPEMLAKLVTGNKLAVTLKNLKAGLQFVLHAGSIVNNCVTDNPNLPLSAAQGKALNDAITTLNSNLTASFIKGSQRQENSKSLPYATYTNFFQYTPDKDGMVYVNTDIKLETLSRLNGLALMQLFSTNVNQSYVNNSCTANPYTNGFGGINLHLDYMFYAKANVTYILRVFQATADSASHELTMGLYSNVTWEEV